ncbi:competence/damage-inducible protein A [Listeria ivanovii]|uniref:competence/damage-inducible protein A n=1 Tax=Listeria ivanovii TaxID=1638 RepID=UPI000DA9D54B|nr:competence/damage-inducible protein A [Listeria ivanovii]PZF89823.1 competence/damage-inducible protein A [Listeria ivanovii]PZF95385.1 competence/damage-inducible protein A [Listeria ivanovii]PZG05688.1 competence/damage-inducible protein A [Listeria ivanovii]PZG10549.1 competence/damage-inducible protein A [Listeria ivanovii]PZG27310.1 competence/damage-inducible protein A [Listeria ivanovii]
MANAEIIAVGTELLLGQIVNSNAAFISQELAADGIYVYHHTVVGDNPERLKKVIKIAENRSDILIFTGGLGPTEDDITKQILAEHLQENLVIDPFHMNKITEHFASRSRTMTENNKLQAVIIEGAIVLNNDYGFAAGMFLQQNNHTYILLPGPPSEMKPMFSHYANPLLVEDNGAENILESKIMRFFGIGESQLAADLNDLIVTQVNPTIATYAGDNEVIVRITATAKTKEEAANLVNETEQEILQRDGAFLYGYGEVSLPELVTAMLLEKNITISAAESFTAGLFQAEIARFPGISKIFKGGMVTYSAETKQSILQVSKQINADKGVVSSECATEMADNVRRLCNTDLGISFTGVAGPDSLEGHPAGTIWIGLSVKGYKTEAYQFVYGRDRNHNRRRAVKQGFQLIKQFLDTNASFSFK